MTADDMNNDINTVIPPKSMEQGCSKCESCDINDKKDCSNSIPFKNLLVVPAEFCPYPCSQWEDLRISVKSNLHCMLSQCNVTDANLVYTDPCGKSHKIENYIVKVKKARIYGSIDYVISACCTLTDICCPPASVSNTYTINVDRVVDFLDDCDINHCSVFIDCKDLCFDDPPEFLYGNEHALKIKGEFILNLGYIKNGNFEHNFSGWTLDIPPCASADTTSNFDTYEPIEGCYFALLKTDGPGSYTKIEQNFHAKAGDKICGWTFFKTNDYFPFDDSCEVSLYHCDEKLESLFFASVTTVGDYGKTPWTYWEYKICKDGQYTVRAGITNVGDSEVDSYMGIDAIKLTSKK